MVHRILATLENLEDRIEKIKWLIAASFHPKKSDISDTLTIINKNAGLLNKRALKGTSFENKIRKEWHSDFLKRTD